MSKEELTSGIIKELGLVLDLDDALKIWWWPTNSANKDHRRLTSAGCAMLEESIKPYKFKFDFDNTPNTLKQLSKINTPYYVDYSGSITVFSPQLASMLMIYPDFNRYLELINSEIS